MKNKLNISINKEEKLSFSEVSKIDFIKNPPENILNKIKFSLKWHPNIFGGEDSKFKVLNYWFLNYGNGLTIKNNELTGFNEDSFDEKSKIKQDHIDFIDDREKRLIDLEKIKSKISKIESELKKDELPDFIKDDYNKILKQYNKERELFEKYSGKDYIPQSNYKFYKEYNELMSKFLNKDNSFGKFIYPSKIFIDNALNNINEYKNLNNEYKDLFKDLLNFLSHEKFINEDGYENILLLKKDID